METKHTENIPIDLLICPHPAAITSPCKMFYLNCSQNKFLKRLLPYSIFLFTLEHCSVSALHVILELEFLPWSIIPCIFSDYLKVSKLILLPLSPLLLNLSPWVLLLFFITQKYSIRTLYSQDVTPTSHGTFFSP